MLTEYRLLFSAGLQRQRCRLLVSASLLLLLGYWYWSWQFSALWYGVALLATGLGFRCWPSTPKSIVLFCSAQYGWRMVSRDASQYLRPVWFWQLPTLTIIWLVPQPPVLTESHLFPAVKHKPTVLTSLRTTYRWWRRGFAWLVFADETTPKQWSRLHRHLRYWQQDK